MIGPANPDEYKGNGADFPLRQAVRDSFNDIFGPDQVCASGWGIDEERYNLLRTIHLYSTEDLKEFVESKRKEAEVKGLDYNPNRAYLTKNKN